MTIENRNNNELWNRYNSSLEEYQITKDLEEVRGLLESEQFAQMRNLVVQWNEDIKNRKHQALFTIHDKIMKNDYIKEHLPQFLDLLLLWYRDILNIKLNRKEFIIYREHEYILNRQALDVTEEQVLNNIEQVLTTKKLVRSHVNPQLALENMILSLWEG